MLMAFVTIVIAMIGYGIARVYRYYVRCRRDGLLEPPIDLEKTVEEEENKENNTTKVHHNNRYTKSQARQRYKKGKM